MQRPTIIPAVRFLLITTFVAAAIIGAARVKIEHASSVGKNQSSAVIQNVGRVQVVSFTLYDRGIYPQEARANPGRVTISIEDLTGSSSGLLIERVESSARVPAGVVNRAANRLRTRAELFLPAGRYELTDASHLESRALLIIEP